ncbi:hypothetical protein BU16DRAFT_543236 [Lophium mytilinum]|uniref:Uncharacterized protein n=1 Tax=Lophium mytilinum TaxID=390894 RepID=A0A6A6QFA3_9PEZI|nr:hypothetical protein BU16DRAFT_543236 [Lophium mytilinum]
MSLTSTTQLSWRKNAVPNSAPSLQVSSQKPTKAALKPGKRFFLPKLADITSSSIVHGQIGPREAGKMPQQLTEGAFEHPVIVTSYRNDAGSIIVTCHSLTSWSERRLEDAWSRQRESWTKVCAIEHDKEVPPPGVRRLRLDKKSAKLDKRSYVFLWTFEVEVENLRFDNADDRHGEVVLDETAVDYLVNYDRALKPVARRTSCPLPARSSLLGPQMSPLLNIRKPRTTRAQSQ